MRAILIDDESLALDFLEHQIKQIGTIEIVNKFNYFDFLKDSTILKEVDIVFLDIEMPRINGLELAEKILEVNVNLSIVFVTAFDKYAIQAFELNALDYILKPVQLTRLKKTIDRMEGKEINQRHPSIKRNNTLQINVSRELTFELAGGEVEYIQWRTTKSQELFLYLLLKRNKIIRKSELIDVLWPDAHEDKAYSQLYTSIYYIRKTLNRYKDHIVIKNVGEGYILSTKESFINLVQWEKGLNSLPPVQTETIHFYEENMRLYTGAYLQEYNFLWAEPERYRLEQLWLKIAKQIAAYYVEQNKFEEAETWYVNICNHRPEDENANFSLMKLYSTLKLGLLVDHQYNQLKKALVELNLHINPDIEEWYNQRKHKVK